MRATVCSSGSKSVLERTVQAVEEQVRVILLSLDAKLGAMVATDEPFVTCIRDIVMHLIKSLEVGKGGKTAHERVHRQSIKATSS